MFVSAESPGLQNDDWHMKRRAEARLSIDPEFFKRQPAACADLSPGRG